MKSNKNKHISTTIPKVEYDKMDFEDGTFSMKVSDNLWKIWKVPTLYKEIEKLKLKPFDIPLAALNTWDLPFDVETMDDFVFQSIRVRDVDDTIPIVLDSYGEICDGNHRFAKALIEGKTTIKAYRLQKMPPPDSYKDDKGHPVIP